MAEDQPPAPKSPDIVDKVGNAVSGFTRMLGFLNAVARMRDAEKNAERVEQGRRENERQIRESEVYKLMPVLLADKELDALYEKRLPLSARFDGYRKAGWALDRMASDSSRILAENEPAPNAALHRKVIEQFSKAENEPSPLAEELRRREEGAYPAVDKVDNDIKALVLKKIEAARLTNPRIEADSWFARRMYYEVDAQKKAQLSEAAEKIKPKLPPYDENKEIYGMVLDDPEAHEKARKEGRFMLHLKLSPAEEERQAIYTRFRALQAEEALFANDAIAQGNGAKAEAATQLFVKLTQDPSDDRESVTYARELIRQIQESKELQSEPVMKQTIIPGLSMYASDLRAHHEKYFPSQKKETRAPEIPGEQQRPVTPRQGMPAGSLDRQ